MSRSRPQKLILGQHRILYPEEEAILHGYVRLLAELGPRRAFSYLHQRWSELTDKLPDEHLLLLVGCLACKSPIWRRCLSRASRRRGHVLHRPQYRRSVQKILRLYSTGEASHPEPVPYEVIRTHRVGRESRLIVFSREQLGLFEDLRFCINQLSDTSKSPYDVRIIFNCDRAYVYGLAITAAWCARNAAAVSVECSSPACSTYLENIGFRDIVERNRTVDSVRYDAENYVALTQISPGETERVNEISCRIGSLFASHTGLSNTQRTALEIAIAEIVENVYRHSGSTFPGYVLAQAHPNERKLHLVVADTGIGILDSFRRADNPAAVRYAKSESKALAGAVKPLVTTKRSRHSGYGLYVVSQLAHLNKGAFRLTSGRSTYLDQPRRSRAKASRRPNEISQHLYWRGTVVGLLLEMDGPLDIRSVYKLLPVPEGYEEEDFFEQ